MNAENSALLTLPGVLVGSLIMASAVTYLLRGWERAVAIGGALFLLGWAAWLWRMDQVRSALPVPFLSSTIDLSTPLERLGFTFRLEAEAVPILVVSLLLVASAFVLTACVSQGRSFVPFTLVLTAGYVTLALLITGPLAPSLLAPLFLAGLSAIGVFILQAGRFTSPSGALRTLVPPVMAFPLFLVAAWYVEQIPLNPQDTTAAQITAQLISIGLIILLSPFPLHGARPSVAQSAPPVVWALLTLLYELAVLHLLYRTVTTFPYLPQQAPLGVWLTWAGLATAVWGGLAAAGARKPGQLWGYAAVHDWGLILLVLAIPGIRSWPLVLFLFGLRTVSMITAAAGLSTLEDHIGGTDYEDFQGVGNRLPWNSAAFLLGGLGLAGFPLSAGFTGHWAALQVVAETDWRLAAVVLVASGAAIFGYIRLARTMFGPLSNRYLRREGTVSVALAILVLTLSVGLAVAPQLLDMPISRALTAFSG